MDTNEYPSRHRSGMSTGRSWLRDVLHLLIRILRRLAPYAHGLYAAFGVLLLVALLLALAGLWSFAQIADAVAEGETQRFDEAVLLWLHRHATPWLDKVALEVTALGNTFVVIVCAVVVSAFLWAAGHRHAVLVLLIAVTGAALANTVLKIAFDRPRPELFELETPYARPLSASFPSGHATASVVLFLVLAYQIHRLAGPGLLRQLTAGGAATLILLIGLSRLYLGVHYPSDVIAGYLFGFAWATFCAFGVEAVRVVRDRPRSNGVTGPEGSTGGVAS